MSQAARILPIVPLAAPDDYLGPAEVVEVRGPAVLVEVPDGRQAEATLALALPYAPVPGDVLLVIGRGEACYVIGVLRGQGRTSIAVQGDVEIASLEGKVVISGGRGVEVRGPEVELSAGKLRILAGAAVQRFASLVQRVTELWSVHAGEAHTLVDEGSFSQSKRAVIQTDETVTIDGKEIHLG
jgi:hypothetical protein